MLPVHRSTAMEPTVFPRSLSRNIPSTFTVSPNFSFDNYVRRFLPEAQSQILGLRYFNVYGPQETHKGRMASVAFHLFHQLRNGGSMNLFDGSEGFRRDFIHVQDTIRINLHFLESGKSGIFNAGTGKARSFTAIGECLREIEGSGELKSIPFPDDLRGKYQEFTEADTTRLREAGYEEEFLSLEEGIRLYHKIAFGKWGASISNRK